MPVITLARFQTVLEVIRLRLKLLLKVCLLGPNSTRIKPYLSPGSPQWSLKPKDAVFGSLDQPTLRCVPTGYPEPLVKWKKQIGNR